MVKTISQRLDYNGRFFGPDENVGLIAQELYRSVRDLPIVSFHGHVDAQLFVDNNRFPNPTELILTLDHYVFRLLGSLGISYDDLGIPHNDGSRVKGYKPDKAWKILADNYYKAAGTPVAQWLDQQLRGIFQIKDKLNAQNGSRIYDQIDEKLGSREFLPRNLYNAFNIEVLCTTDNPWDSLDAHKKIHENPQWGLYVIPGWRPDKVTNIGKGYWWDLVELLGNNTGIEINTYDNYLNALKKSRTRFKELGAVLTDHGFESPFTSGVYRKEVKEKFGRDLKDHVKPKDFDAFMFMEYARMSAKDGLVMQAHVGVDRDHSLSISRDFGQDKGHDMPIHVEFIKNFRCILNELGHVPNFKLVVYCQDPQAYYRELVPLAGSYPALYLGENWWMFDEARAIEETLQQTLGRGTSVYKKAGFPDDTRGFLSIPVRHDTARRAYANGLATMASRGEIGKDDASKLIKWLSYEGPRQVFNISKTTQT